MVHQYKLNGYNIVLDVDSGSIHLVDDLVYEIVSVTVNIFQIRINFRKFIIYSRTFL